MPELISQTNTTRGMAAAPKVRGNRLQCAAALLAAACWAHCALAKQEPLYEFGLGLGAIAFEDYRGSDTVHGLPLPLPYILYNGKFLKANRDGIRGTLFNQDRFELNLSFDATTPVRNGRERSGMPDLKPTVELGPSVDVHLVTGLPVSSWNIHRPPADRIGGVRRPFCAGPSGPVAAGSPSVRERRSSRRIFVAPPLYSWSTAAPASGVNARKS